jgi:deazaflavin-dependent oxidoreductase (nitroreductase family)
MEASDADEAWSGANMHYVLLRTIGRKSGKERKAALPYWKDDDGHPIVVASYAGAEQHPAWYLNLEDRKANPEVCCRLQKRAFWADAEILDGDEYQAIWQPLSEDRPFYREYQALTKRRIPLVRLRAKREA